ncbi:MAG TPA: sulfatase [Firmicutes bacterium]|nr:sulfatase [Bacillota bacterium]
MNKKPNIVFVLADDLGYMDLSCYGSNFYETPNLDRLAAEGMYFTDAYASSPVCSPSRASILSGKYPATVGVTNYIGGKAEGRLIDAPYLHYLPLSEYSLAKAFKDAGYDTWHVGKWHLGAAPYYPEHHGFDANIGGNSWGGPKYGYFSPWGIETLPDAGTSPGQYLTDRLTDEAIKLIKSRRDSSRPFFLNLWHHAVHIPAQAKEEVIPKYEEKARRLGLDKVHPLEEGEFFPCRHKMTQRVTRRFCQSHPVYAAMIDILDDNVGRLRRALAECGELENTIFVFTSDNGGLATAESSPTCNAPLREGKGWLYEGGVRVPLIISWPGVIKPGSRCTAPVIAPDFYPTLLEAAGLPARPEQHCDGLSFLPLLHAEKELNRQAIYWHYPHYSNQGGTPSSAVRAGDYKLIEFFEDGRLELYNLRTDPGERKNLAPSEPEIARELHKMLTAWRKKVGAILPERNNAFPA